MTTTAPLTRPAASPAASATTLAITGMGVVSPFGDRSSDFVEAIVAGRTSLADVAGHFDAPLPRPEGHYLAGLDARAHLGRKGTSTMDRTTVLTLVAAAEALSGHGDVVERSRFGMVLGTTAGSTRSTSDYSLATFVEDKPYLVNPMIFPNAVMNCAAGQTAIRHGLRGVNATVAGGQTAVLSALRYARRMIALDRADHLLVGAAEELSPQWAWEHHHTVGRLGATTPAGEGSALFVVESAATVAPGRAVLAEVLATEVRTHPTRDGRDEDFGDTLAAAIEAALADAGVTAGDVWAVASSENGSRLDAHEDRAIRAVVGPDPLRVRVKHSLGEARSASTALQLAALVGLSTSGTAPRGAVMLATSHTPDGSVGATVLRGGGDA